jgi:hypothetical protein
MIRAVTPGVGAVLPSAPVPLINLPMMGVAPLASTPLPLVSAAVLPAITPSVAVNPVAVNAVPNTPFAPALSPENAAPSVARPEPAATIPASDAGAESAAAESGARFDGSVPSNDPPPIVAVPKPAPAPLGSGLAMAQDVHTPWLLNVVGLLNRTRTGRRVLRDIDALAARRGRPIMLDVKLIGNNGEFRYDSDMLIMDSGHLKRDPYQSAPILAHELQHVLQRALELPADALELEIESYTVENRVWSELGVEPEMGSFARLARARIRKDAGEFAKWLGNEYKNNIPLYGSTVDAYVAHLEKNLKTAKAAAARTLRKRATVERVLDSMRANGMPEEAIAAHRRDELEPLERSLRDGVVNRGWIERDLVRLKEPAIREIFRAYSRGVMRRARALSRS